ncbi:type I restriction-modification enzyme R subunit C-terminal domain-containing protein, partial [uncultured Duncaniella sp.]|uniref:type I restriction-modification enzyme R subunit C-terminal domain-containing protein n=1 Tax=uncultured Duncaniella sp. TaxID=2768039 RepID=UPI00271201BA
LIFALNEAHANNIVKIAKEVFGKEDDNKFVQKITYSSGDSDALIRSFRNDKDFRIAVTCTLVATGTDVKPLEVLIFMRDVRSEPLYIQMKGRGTRTIGDDVLRNVTPNAFSKDCFFLVDAVGVTESEKTVPAPGEDEGTTETITFKKLLERMTHGELPDGYFKLLAARLARISSKCTEGQRNEFTELTHGITMADLSERMFKAIDPETSPSLPPYRNVNEPNLERKGLFAPLANNPKARELLLTLNAGFIKTLMPGKDTLISKGFSMEEAQDTTSAFEDYCKTHADEIEALRIIYNNSGEPLTYSMLSDLSVQLRRANSQFNVSQLWNCYSLLNREKVKLRSTQEEKEALTNIIQLVRYALGQIDRLDSLCSSANQYFNLWYGQLQRNISDKQIEVIKQVVRYIASNGAVTIKDIREEDKSQAAQLVKAFGNLTEANKALLSLAGFIIYHRNVA